MTKLDQALCRTLIAEARRQYGLVEVQGYGVRAGTMHDIADQLEAALAETDRLKTVVDVGDLLAGRLLAERDALAVARNTDRTEWMATYATMRAEIDRLTEELSHATSHDGDWLSKASRSMCETVLGDRDALRAKVRDLEAWGRNEVQRANDTATYVLAERDARIAALEALVAKLRCGDLGAFHDGELSPEREAAFREHLTRCSTCEAGLLPLMQLDARLRAAAPDPTRTR